MPVTSEPSADSLITSDQLAAMGDAGSCELIDGRIVPMVPTDMVHGVVESNLGIELSLFAREKDLGWVMTGEVGIVTRRGPDRVRGADVAFLSRQRWAKAPTGGYLETAPEVVAEIVSPNDYWQDIRQKIEEYFSIGVQQVWILEPGNRAVLIYGSATEARKYSDDDTIFGEGILQGLELPVARLFP